MGRNPCCSKEGLNRGAWTASEDELLINYVNAHGIGGWRNLPNRAGLSRCGKSCRLRWLNYLRPDIKRGNISLDEEELIIRLHKLLGNRWTLIAGRVPGRTDNEIKNYWNTSLGKKVKAQSSCPQSSKTMNPKTTTTPTSLPATATQPKPIQTQAFRCTKLSFPILPPPDNNQYINSTTVNSLDHSKMGTGIEDINGTCFDDPNFFNFSVDKLQASNSDANLNYNYNNSLSNESDHSLQFDDLLLEDWTATMDMESLAFLLND